MLQILHAEWCNKETKKKKKQLSRLVITLRNPYVAAGIDCTSQTDRPSGRLTGLQQQRTWHRTIRGSQTQILLDLIKGGWCADALLLLFYKGKVAFYHRHRRRCRNWFNLIEKCDHRLSYRLLHTPRAHRQCRASSSSSSSSKKANPNGILEKECGRRRIKEEKEAHRISSVHAVDDYRSLLAVLTYT